MKKTLSSPAVSISTRRTKSDMDATGNPMNITTEQREVTGGWCGTVYSMIEPEGYLKQQNEVRLNISVFRGSHKTTIPTENIDSWDELVDMLTFPQRGEKDGDYFLRGLCNGTRSNANMVSSDVIIIDGDKTLDNPASCVPLQPVHAVLVQENITHVIYNSFSNSPLKGINKWRAVIPCSEIGDKQLLEQGVAEIITIFHKAGLKVSNVSENNILAQPWYLPRCPAATFDDFECAYHDGDTYTLTGKKIPSATYQDADTDPFQHQDSTNIAPLIKQVLSGESYHPALLRLSASLIGSGNGGGSTRRFLRGLMDQATVKDKRWDNRYEQIPALVKSAIKKYRGDVDTNIEIETPDWPVLSSKALPGIVGEFVQLATENSEADPAAVLATLLTRFAVEVGAGPHMWIGDTPHRARLATVIVGASSKARKGTSGKPVKRLFNTTGPIDDFSDYTPAQSTPGPFSSGEGIIHLIRDETKNMTRNLRNLLSLIRVLLINGCLSLMKNSQVSWHRQSGKVIPCQ